jgi:AcrR family transcriptional regulator
VARPNLTEQRRAELLPVVAKAFAELGYRRATTAELARRCKVRENILYRLWSDKKTMFIAAIGYVYDQAAHSWQRVLREGDPGIPAPERLLKHEAQHYGESGLHRIIYAGLNETDDPDVRRALRTMYDRFHRFIHKQVGDHRGGRAKKSIPDAVVSAWAIVGLGNVANISRELGLLTDRQRQRLIADAGRLLLSGEKT